MSQVHIFYDGPKLFTAESTSGQIYLSFWLGEGASESDRWLYVPMSVARNAMVRRGDLSLRDACLNPEDGWVWLVKVWSGGDVEDEAQISLPTDLEEQDLPTEDARLAEIEHRPEPTLEKAHLRAHRTRREVFDLALDVPNANLKEIAADDLGDSLLNVQSLVENIAYAQTGSASRRGRIPSEVKREAKMMATDVFASSFGVRLESKAQTDLFGQSSVGAAVDTLVELLDAGRDESKISGILKLLGGRVVSKYISLLKAWGNNNISVTTAWGSPSNPQKLVRVSMSSSEADYIADMLADKIEDFSEEIRVKGVLEGIDIQSKRFKILDLEEEDRITGKLKDEFVSTAKKVAAEVPKTYIATLIETQEVNRFSGESSVKYELVDIESP